MRLLIPALVFALSFVTLPAGAEVSLFGAPPLVTAVTKNDVAGVRAALIAQPNTNYTVGAGKTLLMVAAENGNAEIAKLLIESRANPNAQDRIGNTPLIYGVTSDNVAVIDVLIAGGARLNDANKQGLTPLMEAARAGKSVFVQHLLDAGAKASQTDYTGRTALDWAQDSRNRSTIALLTKAQ